MSTHQKIQSSQDNLEPTQSENRQHRIKPVIRIIGGELPEIVDAAERSLLTDSKTHIYQRGGMLVRAISTNAKPRQGIKRAEGALIIQPVEIAYLVERFTKTALWERFDAHKDDWKRVDCPKIVAETYLARGIWKVPILTGIIQAPTLRPDGSILATQGYDEQTGLLFYTCTTSFSTIPLTPNKEDANKAVETFKKLLSGFPFVEETDFSVTLSAFLTALIRYAIRTAPLHGFSAPKMGAGKSLLADCIAMVATGRTAAVISQADSPEEEKKRLLAVLMEGDPVVCIDNIERPLGSDSLCSVLTQETWKERLLGKNKTVTVPTSVTFLATGNNLTFQGDLSTRALICMLDPQCERPEERSFEVNLYKYIPDYRDELVKAGLTILRAYHVAGRPKQDIPPFGRFEEWSDLVRSSLIWLGLSDPCKSRKRIEDADPIRANLKALLVNWYACIQKPATLKDIIQTAQLPRNAGLYETLMELAGEKGEINHRKLGQRLKSLQGRIEEGLRLEQAGKTRENMLLWLVRPVKPSNTKSG